MALKKVLFLTPNSSRTGANIFLLRLLSWLSVNSDLHFDIFYEYGGELEVEYRQLAKSRKFQRHNESHGLIRKGLIKLEDKYGIGRWRLKRELAREEYNLIVSNTAANHTTLPLVADLGIPAITYCHELECVIQMTGIEGFRKTRDISKHFIAVSNAVRDHLVNVQLVPEERVSVIYGFLPLGLFEQRLTEKRNEIRKEIGVPENSFLVGASGTLNWRKAPDVFIRIADAVARENSNIPIYFVWIGGANEGDEALFCARYDVEKMGLSERIKFLPHLADPNPYFAALDVFAMVSREDPFPLVCLESAAFGVPIICFENAGGMPEFVGDDCGFVVPYMDIGSFADRIMELYRNPGLRKAMGAKAAQKVRQDHDIEKEAPKVLKIIRETLL